MTARWRWLSARLARLTAMLLHCVERIRRQKRLGFAIFTVQAHHPRDQRLGGQPLHALPGKLIAHGLAAFAAHPGDFYAAGAYNYVLAAQPSQLRDAPPGVQAQQE